jgi:hypothetical protein
MHVADQTIVELLAELGRALSRHLTAIDSRTWHTTATAIAFSEFDKHEDADSGRPRHEDMPTTQRFPGVTHR